MALGVEGEEARRSCRYDVERARAAQMLLLIIRIRIDDVLVEELLMVVGLSRE